MFLFSSNFELEGSVTLDAGSCDANGKTFLGLGVKFGSSLTGTDTVPENDISVVQYSCHPGKDFWNCCIYFQKCNLTMYVYMGELHQNVPYKTYYCVCHTKSVCQTKMIMWYVWLKGQSACHTIRVVIHFNQNVWYYLQYKKSHKLRLKQVTMLATLKGSHGLWDKRGLVVITLKGSCGIWY